MNRKNIYVAPESELLILNLEEGLLYETQRGGVSAQSVTVEEGQWD